jgi:kinesin family protein 3/17
VENKENILTIKKGADAKDFVFDYVFGIESRQAEVYDACGYSLVENALEGFNGTIFAYGQTGAGKTFTMVGDYKDPNWKGIIPRGFDHVIAAIQTSENRKYVVRASFIEIYNEDVFDLLDMKGDVKKDVKESPQTGVFVKDLKTVPVKSVEEMFKLLDYGNTNRSVATTKMNATSSRSHALFTVHIESIEGEKIKGSKLNFVDLAGSERQGKTGATGDTLK